MSFPVPPTSLPGLAPLLAGDVWPRWTREGRVFPVPDLRAAVRYVRLKPRTSCRIAVLEDDPDAPGGVSGFLLHLYPDAARAAAAFEKVSSRKSTAAGNDFAAFLDPAVAAVVSPFPDDPELPALRHFHRDYRLKQALHEHLERAGAPAGRVVKHRTARRLLAYKPGRRAVYRVDVCHERAGGRTFLPVYARVEARGSFGPAVDKLSAIHAAGEGDGAFRLVAPVTPVAGRGWILRSWVPGRSLAEAPRGAADEFDRAGRSLAALHGLRPRLAERAGRWPVVLRRQAEGVAELMPSESERVTGIARRLAATLDMRPARAEVLLHGDLHPGQVILGADGPSLVDFDRAAYGEAARDLGSMLAYLEEAGRTAAESEAFLAGYRAATGALPSRERLSLATAASAFGRLTVPFRQLAADWPERVRARLDRIESSLAAVAP